MKYRHVAALVGGFALDSLLGDPQGWPHPVRFVGKQIEFEEGLIRKYLMPEMNSEGAGGPLAGERGERVAGAALAFDVALMSPVVVQALLAAASRVNPALSLLAETALCYQLLAARSLRDESMKVHDALAAGDLPAARKAVALIVGRDTDALDEEGVARATVETIAENASDGVIAPLLFMGVGGAPAAMMYKAVNTLDSMVGYKNDRYLNLGCIPAKLDDAMNFVPARVAGVLMCAGAHVAGFDAKRAWKTFKRDRRNHTSPNSAHTEAACAGALGVQLGGASTYFGKVVKKPTIGDALRPIEPADIERANDLMYVTAAIGVVVSAAIGATIAHMRPKG